MSDIANTVHTGGCVCGRISYAVIGKPERMTICHCAWCQRRTGTAYGTELVYHLENIQFSGADPRSYRHTSDESGRWLDVFFCADCGCNLGFVLEAVPGVRTIPAGTLDQPEWLENIDVLVRQVYARTKRCWSELTPATEIYETHFR